MDIPICDRKKESCASDSICRSSVFILLREFFLFENGICVVDLFMGVANLKKFRRERFFYLGGTTLEMFGKVSFCDLRESTVVALQK